MRLRLAKSVRDRAIALALLAPVVCADYLAGPEFVLAIFYLIPIGFTAWRLTRRESVLAAVLCWMLALYNSGVFGLHLREHPAVVLLDALTTLGFFVFAASLITYLRVKQAELQAAIDTDLVTGATSARGFYRHAEREIYRSHRYGHPLTVAYLDVDNFKQVNDTYGHQEGDRLLRIVAQTIKRHIRAADRVGRLGGDEFVILFSETDGPSARRAVENVRGELRARMQMENWPVTFSFGVLTCGPLCPGLEEVLREADHLMYSVKKSGKNAVAYEVALRGDVS